jgi:hypothetical protein
MHVGKAWKGSGRPPDALGGLRAALERLWEALKACRKGLERLWEAPGGFRRLEGSPRKALEGSTSM